MSAGTLSDSAVQEWAEYLLAAMDECRETVAITKSIPDLSASDAYRIQLAAVDLRVGRGDVVVGAKLGLTSRAKQQQMGVDEPIFGWLFDSGSIAPEEPVDTSALIHSRIEPEIVFQIGDGLNSASTTRHDVLDASSGVSGGLEVIDSRYEAFSFTLPDVIADNTSAARFLEGSTLANPRDVDLALLGCVFDVDGVTRHSATGAALLGDPATCVAMLARHMHQIGRPIQAGWTILAGSLTDAVPFGVGTTVTASYAGLGSVTSRAV